MDLHERGALLLEAGQPKNSKLRALLLRACEDDILYWFDTFCWTQDTRLDDPREIPFKLFPFQEWFVKELLWAIENQEDIGVEKSRDMGVSWMIALTFQYCWLFKPGWHFHIGTRTMQEVDQGGEDTSSIFGKLRYNLYRLPRWMRPEALTTNSNFDKHMMLVNPENGNVISGEAPVRAFGRGPRKRAVWLDEFQEWSEGHHAYLTCASTTNCRIISGTPDGEDNEFARVMHSPSNEIREAPDAKKLRLEKNYA